MNKSIAALYETDDEGISRISGKVFSLLRQNVDPGKIAVTYQLEGYGEIIEQYFKSKNLPFYSKRNINILEHFFINKITQLLVYIATEQQQPYSGDAILFEILHFDFFDIPSAEITRLTAEMHNRKKYKTATAMRKLLREKAVAPPKDLFDPGIDKNLKAVSAILERLIAYPADMNVLQLFERIITEASIVEHIEKSDEKILLNQLLTALTGFIRIETVKDPGLTLTQLINIIAANKNDGRPLPLQITTGSFNGIHIICLQETGEQRFDHIINTGAGDENNTLLRKATQRPEIKQMDEDFIAPIVNKFVMNVSALNNYLKCPLGFYYKNIIRVPDRHNEAMNFGSAIHYALEKFFKKMPAGYQGPASLTATPVPGNVFASGTEMVKDFEWYVQQNYPHIKNDAFKKRVEYGSKLLTNYYERYIHSWNKIVSIERNISGVTVNDVPLKGKIDKLEFDGNEINIVDYKSGSFERAATKLAPPNDKCPNGGDYWRQAVFYKILIDNYDSKAWTGKSVEFDFVEPDNNNEYRKIKVRIGLADIETVKQQFVQAWAKIQSRDFYTGCGRPGCRWCSFVKTNNLAMAMHRSNNIAED